MNNLANTYGHVGRLEDSAVMHQKTLEFRQRVLPEDHPTIGAALCCGCDDCGCLISAEIDVLIKAPQ